MSERILDSEPVTGENLFDSVEAVTLGDFGSGLAVTFPYYTESLRYDMPGTVLTLLNDTSLLSSDTSRTVPRLAYDSWTGLLLVGSNCLLVLMSSSWIE
jgi:hypothetical protein